MKRQAIRRLVLSGGPGRRGTVHGATFRGEIRAYTAERMRLATDGSWAGRGISLNEALALAEEMLPAHRKYDADLYEEMRQMSVAAGISMPEAVIVGGFTDFVDAVRAMGGTNLPEEDDCTAALVPGHAAGGSAYLAQTWDMHASATRHVILMQVQPEEGPSALLFSTVGCLGQIGMNCFGIAVGISNLSAMDGKPGVTWPFVVRRILAQSNLEDALACVLAADLAGARNFLLLDRNGNGYAVEATPSSRFTTRLADAPLVHTNHCLHHTTRHLEAPRPPDLMASSEARLTKAVQLLQARPITLDRLIAMTREPVAICRRAQAPHFNETSGAAILRPSTGDFWACWGIPADNPYEHMSISLARETRAPLADG